MKKNLYILYLSAGILVLVISIYGFFLLKGRPGFPQNIKTQNIKQADGFIIEHEKDLEFILSKKAVGDKISILVEIDGIKEKKVIELEAFYSQSPFPLIYLIIGLFTLALGVFVFIVRRERERARIFYFATLAFSIGIIVNGGYYCLRADWISYIPGIVYYFLYPLSPALLLHFSFLFSKSRGKAKKILIYSPALIFGGILTFLFLFSTLRSSIQLFRYYQSAFYFLRSYIIFYILLPIYLLIRSFRKSYLEEERAQIKWVFFGLFLGTGPLIFLYQIPQVLTMNPLISDEIATVFLIFVPAAFAISILKYKLMNIELIINRSLVYSSFTVFTVSIYLFSIRIFQSLLSRFVKEATVSLIAAVASALAFNLVRKKIQRFIDKSFFRQSYDYKKNILSFQETAHKIVKMDQLCDSFLEKTGKTLPLIHLGVFIHAKESGKPPVKIERNGKIKDYDFLDPEKIANSKILARKKAVRTEENVDFSLEKILEEKKLELILPLSFKSTGLTGFLSSGKKKSGERFSRDDLDLLVTMAGELALNLERIRLQEEVIFERAEKEKLDELNRLKTEFVSTVSHEIRTPMTSIRSISEILQEGRVKKEEKQKELLDLIVKESSRLSRFLHNILDAGKIEQQSKKYNFEESEINSIIDEVVKIFKYNREPKNLTIRVFLPEKPVFLKIDRDAVKQALTNLVDNAIKYSLEERVIDVRLTDKSETVEIEVRDKGIGISNKDREKIFDGFYRAGNASIKNPKGVGLGLKVTKHIMDAHGGRIEVESRTGKGSSFCLIFKKNEKNTDHRR